MLSIRSSEFLDLNALTLTQVFARGPRGANGNQLQIAEIYGRKQSFAMNEQMFSILLFARLQEKLRKV